jgi:hypothetical protein
MSLPPPITACSLHPGVSARRFRARLIVLLLATVLCGEAYGRGPDPPQRIPLEPFGYQPIAERYLLEGASMLSLDYVDNRHLLVTFGISKLMVRLADCPPDDEDRVVKAVLLELPSGRELAHTEWRFHDVGQYLWNLGDGHFMLRRRDVLTTFAPLQQLANGHAFEESSFLHFDRRINQIFVSANHDLLSIETVKRKPPADPQIDPQNQSQNQAAAQSQPAARRTGLLRHDKDEPKPDPTPVETAFIRLVHRYEDDKAEQSGTSAARDATAGAPDAGRPSRIVASLDGRIFTSKPVRIPLTSEGFLQSKAATRDGVLLDFLTFTGKDIDLGDFPTSCPPRPTFVSPSEFVAFGCRGSDDSLELAGFNLRGDLIWQINFSDLQAYPSIVSAVSAGRFAFSRTILTSNVFGAETPSMSQLTAQEVRVIQMYNGKQLLRVTTSPIQRAGQNFTLSPDGLSLAVVHDNISAHGPEVVHSTSIEIYKLPSLSEKDESQVKVEAAMAPEPANVHMHFSVEEIRAAINTKPAAAPAEEDASRHPATPADSHIVGDAIPPANPSTTASAKADTTPAAGIIPSSDPAPSCDPAPDAKSGTQACPVKPQTQSSEEMAGDPDAAPEHRRKPPTLYEPAPANPPASPPQ